MGEERRSRTKQWGTYHLVTGPEGRSRQRGERVERKVGDHWESGRSWRREEDCFLRSRDRINVHRIMR
jgi:hypothetical protein